MPSQKLTSNVYQLPATPQLESILTKLRQGGDSRENFIFQSDRISRIVMEAGLNLLPTEAFISRTITGNEFTGVSPTGKICGVSVLRAGEAMEPALRACCRSARIGKILIQRNRDTSLPKLIYSKLPEDIANRWVLLLDPMLATGGSAVTAISVLLASGVREANIIFLNIISCPEGLQAITVKYPDVKIVTGWQDAGLDETNHIVPGLGDFGDRYFSD